ncbi:MAG: DNA gyrase C-terminal beta-propeller domain-containing protein, partial [Planctomycetota bacterium]
MLRPIDLMSRQATRGKLQRLACRDIKSIGRNTQGVRIMRMDEGDMLAAVVKVPPGEEGETAA